jgi:hypothetical protein
MKFGILIILKRFDPNNAITAKIYRSVISSHIYTKTTDRLFVNEIHDHVIAIFS